MRKLFALLASLALVAHGGGTGCCRRPPKRLATARRRIVRRQRGPSARTKQAAMNEDGASARHEWRPPRRVVTTSASSSPRASTSSWRGRARTRSGPCSASSARRSTRPTAARAGPLHNQIPQPDRTVDNTSIWTLGLHEGLLREHAVLGGARRGLDAELLHRAVVEPLHRQRRRSRTGCSVPFNEAHYGTDYCGSIVCAHRLALRP